MKILKAVMLGFLVTVCAVAAFVTVLHFTGFELFGRGSGNEAPLINRSNRSSDAEENDSGFFIPYANARADDADKFRFWQRTAFKPEGSDYWHYFPIISPTALPGETVVLGVSTIGFKGWKADPNHTLVELFDEYTDGENAYVSFIMPETSVSIAALYDEIPDINYEKQHAEITYQMSQHEHGNAVAANDTGGLRPEQDVEVIMPSAIIGRTYNVRLNDPVLPPLKENEDPWELKWVFNFPTALSWMRWQPTPLANGRGGIIRTDGLAQVPEPPGGPHLFSVDIFKVDGTVETFIDTYAFLIHVRRPDEPPDILTTRVPDGMVEVDYNVPIVTGGIPENTSQRPSVWVWSVITNNAGVGGELPDGLELWNHPTDFSTGAIRSIDRPDGIGPTAASLTGGLGDGPTYSFRISIDPTTATRDAYPTFGELVSKDDLNITVWPQLAVTPPKWTDGMVAQPYNPTFPASVSTDLSFDVEDGDDVLTAYPTGWGWVRGGDELPEGLKFDLVDIDDKDLTRVAIHGAPNVSTESKSYTIVLRFQSTNRGGNGIIGESREVSITIYIWPRPEIKDWAGYEGKLPDGMVGAPAPGTDFTDEDYKGDAPPIPYKASSSVFWSVAQPEPDEIYAPGMRVRSDGSIADGFNISALIPDGLDIELINGVPNILWTSWTGDKPTHTPVGLPMWAIPDSELRYTTVPDSTGVANVGQTLSIVGKTTDATKAGDYKLNLGFQIFHENPNINGARTDETFDLRIWRRAYLSVIMRHPEIQEWTQAGIVYRSGTMEQREYGRAVIPGQWGTIRSMQTGSNFIRWEVNIPVQIPRERLSPGAPLTDWPGIGENWELTPPGGSGLGWVHLRMPLPESPTANPINVVINGWHSPAPRVIGNSPSIPGNLPPGEFGKNYTGQFMVANFGPAVLGNGPLALETFNLANLPGDTFPDGVNVIPQSGSLWGPPEGTVPETFNFHISLTLKGTMKLTYGFHPAGEGLIRGDGSTSTPYSMFIDTFKPTHGDFNGDGKLDLTDLILLSKWVHAAADSVERANAEAQMRLRDGWRNSITPKSSPDSWPDGTDLQELAKWFANDGAYAVWKQAD